MTLPPQLASVRSSLVLVPAALVFLLLAGWYRANTESEFAPWRIRGAATTHSGDDAAIAFSYQSRERTAVLVVPSGAVPAAGWPIVLLLHGAGGSAEQILDDDGWRAVATRERFAVIAADGTPQNESMRARFVGNPRTWNSGAGSGLSTANGSAAAKDVDDVGYLVSLLDSVARRAPIDPRRVFVAGHSNGAGMSYRFAAEHPERVAAVGVMAGHLLETAAHTLKAPVSLLQIVGDHDPLVPMNGGPVRLGAVTGTLQPALDSPKRWASMLGLSHDARVIRDDSVTVRQWGPTSTGAVVLSYVVKGHGHGWLWPGADLLPERVVGPRRESLNATETMWAFFAAHARS